MKSVYELSSTMSYNTISSLAFSSLLIGFILLLPHCKLLTICRADEVEDETPFTYEKGSETGPDKWGLINPEWRTCNYGKMQSPIDFLDQSVQVSNILGRLKRDYKPAHATIKNRGHDITVTWKKDAGKINLNGTDYNLVMCHWHSPSEHTFNGSRYQLELHIVHISSHGEIAVVGILYKYGRLDGFLRKLFHHINAVGHKGEGSSHMSSIRHKERHLGIINPGDIKFGSRKYYRYIGSLTVPPCSEGVIWTISKKVRTVSRDQVRALRKAVHDGFESNARPIQKSDGRFVWLYNPRSAKISA
ncbi:hypothetical protein SAY87_017694 [Trapa incisa]|uniref:carbonic anhydrase n=1 Tax=Trapa incisa TaxID=236973 RepID=A0AAN7L175_9MYRT|nr:hypothetical protein SAY87_017694 [Trapa incisa]